MIRSYLGAQVEEMIFEVPRNRFTDNSEVFADMFRLPQVADGSNAADVEGRNKDHPIFLEGYQAADFAALLKVLYPSYVKSLNLQAAVLTQSAVTG